MYKFKEYLYQSSEIPKILNNIRIASSIREKLGFEDTKKSIEVTTEEIVNNSSIKTVKEVYEYLKSKYGNDLVDWSSLYEDLNVFDKDLIIELSNVSTKDGRLELLNNNYLIINRLDDVLDLLPVWYKMNFELFGIFSPTRVFDFPEAIEPEFKIKQSLVPIINIEEEIKRKIYEVFKPGLILTGPQIKETLGKIYETSGYNKTPKIKDLTYLFDIQNTRKGYLLNIRK